MCFRPLLLECPHLWYSCSTGAAHLEPSLLVTITVLLRLRKWQVLHIQICVTILRLQYRTRDSDPFLVLLVTKFRGLLGTGGQQRGEVWVFRCAPLQTWPLPKCHTRRFHWGTDLKSPCCRLRSQAVCYRKQRHLGKQGSLGIGTVRVGMVCSSSRLLLYFTKSWALI